MIEKLGQKSAETEDKSRRQAGQNDRKAKEPREETNYTHFVSIPIKNPVIRGNFDQFKKTILDNRNLGV